MATALETVRALIQDTGTSPRFSDSELNILMDDSMMELNVWANTTWTVANLDDVPSPVPLSHQQIFHTVVKLRVVESIITNEDAGDKFSTQDVMLDGSTAASRMNRAKTLLERELDKKLTYWLGIKHGAVMRHTGDNWGGT